MTGNALFGLGPLLFLYAIYIASDRKICGDALDGLIYEGAVLFVCLAIVGSVLVDYWLSGLHANGFSRFATYFVPAVVLGVVLINYL